ncbi:MAG: hypothetical protein IJ399_01995 [Bacilli bacterium]|nr:hypothetical protein [Bacilli bacterium]
MTLQELKNKNYVFSNIKDNDLIRIFNEVLKLNPEIKNMNYDLDLNSVYRVIYSKVYIDWFINKKMSNNKFSKAYKCEEILTVLREFLVRASKLKGFGKEVSYINENIMKFEKIKELSEQLDSSLTANMDALINLNPKDVSKLNKEALAIYMYTQLQKLNQGLDQVKISQKDIVDLTSENKRLQEEVERLKAELEKKNVQATLHEDVNSSSMQPLIPGTSVQNAPRNTVHQMKALIPENCIHDLRNRGIIPSSITDQELIDYCNNVLNFSPKLVDRNSVLSASQINVVVNSNLFANAKIKSETNKNHNSVIKNYESLISNYENMLRSMGGKKEFEAEIEKINQVIGTLKNEMSTYKDIVSSIGVQDYEQQLNFAVSGNSSVARGISDVSKAVVNDQQDRLGILDSEIASLSDRRDNLKDVQAKGLTGIKRDIQVMQMDARLKGLRKKQGRIQSAQKKIIGVNVGLYRRKMERQFKKYVKEQEKLAYAISKKKNLVSEIESKEKRLALLNLKIKDASTIQMTKVGKTIEGAKVEKYKREQKALEERLKNLRSKAGSVNLAEQYQTSFDAEISYAL